MGPFHSTFLLIPNTGTELTRSFGMEPFHSITVGSSTKHTLRGTGVDIIIDIINKLSSPRGDKITEAASAEEKTDMETDVEGRDLVSAMDSGTDGTNDEQFSHLSIFHVMVLLHRAMEKIQKLAGCL